MQLIDLTQRTPEWQGWRWLGITATESAVILNRSPYKTPWRLWCEKVGKANPPDLSKNPLVTYGREHEDEARRLFELSHTDVVMPACAEYDGNRVFRASFDGLTTAGEPVEIKCPSPATLSDVRLRGVESDAFRLYNVQLQHQMLVADAQSGWLVFYDGEKNDLVQFDVSRDDSLIAEIVKKGEAFWEAVIKKIEPPKDPQRDFFIPKDDEEMARWCRLAADYRSTALAAAELEAQLADVNAVRRRCKEALSEMMGDFRNADLAGVALTKRAAPQSIDYEALLRAKGIGEAELAGYRKKGRESWLIRSTDSPLPRDFVDEDLREELLSMPVSEAMWY